MAIDSPLTIESLPGNAPGTVILRLTGPLILTTVLALRAEFRGSELPRRTILDLSGVPYMDSAGMSEIINHEVYCRDNQARLILAGVIPRVCDSPDHPSRQSSNLDSHCRKCGSHCVDPVMSSHRGRMTAKPDRTLTGAGIQRNPSAQQIARDTQGRT